MFPGNPGIGLNPPSKEFSIFDIWNPLHRYRYKKYKEDIDSIVDKLLNKHENYRLKVKGIRFTKDILPESGKKLKFGQKLMSRQNNQKKWFGLINEYKSFSGTQISYCEVNQLNKGTFAYWLKKYNKDQVELSNFVEVRPHQQLGFTDLEVYVGPSRIKFNNSASLNDVFDFLLKLKAYA